MLDEKVVFERVKRDEINRVLAYLKSLNYSESIPELLKSIDERYLPCVKEYGLQGNNLCDEINCKKCWQEIILK